MSDKKEYSPLEVAHLIAERLQVLAKSANSAHEIDAGEEPNDDNAECPPSLADSGFSSESSENSEKSEYSEDSEMEDQPLGDFDEEDEDEDEDEDEED